MQFKIDLKIFILIVLFYVTKQIGIYALILGFAIIHEFGHLVSGLLLGMKPSKMQLKPYGVSIIFKLLPNDYNKKIGKGNVLELKKIIVALAGPLTNLVIIIVLMNLNLNLNLFWGLMIVYANILLIIFNLMPIYPLDGGRILKGILYIIFGKKKAEKYTNYISFIFLIWGYDIIKNGIKNIFYKMPNMDSLVGIGVLVNYLYSIYNAILVYMGDSSCTMKLYFEASSMIILFVKLGRYIDKKNKERAVDSIKNLVMITPKNGTILKNGKEVVVTINEINKGDTVITKPGEKISVDGTIIKGTTHTDESFITGESKPITKKIGDKVIAGSINYDGYIEYTAERIGKDSSISNIVNMVMEATSTKTKIQRLADKISGYFVPTIFVIAILSLILNLVVTKETANAFVAFVSVLVVACPCALGLATPLAMVVSIGTCSKKGILIKSSETLESLHKVDTIVLDKTGTITQGKLTVVDGKFSKENFEILQSLESKSNHPIAKSICSNIKNSYEVKEFEEEINQSENPLKLAIQLAIVGNYIDCIAMSTIDDKVLNRLLMQYREIKLDDKIYKLFTVY